MSGMNLFPGFTQKRVKTSGATINLVVGGSGSPVLLLHGYPQTHAMWHKVAPQLARDYTVVCADLRGYGDSSKPRGIPGHANYSKRAMALDMAEAMENLGFARFHVVGHDRGGRVAHRLARDHGRRVQTLTVLDISPTLKMYQSTNMQFAKAYYHWFFLIQEGAVARADARGHGAAIHTHPPRAESGIRSSIGPRSPSTRAASIRTPRARTTAPRPPSTWCTTAKICERNCRCRCWRSGAGKG